jgi:hypothetical protein
MMECTPESSGCYSVGLLEEQLAVYHTVFIIISVMTVGCKQLVNILQQLELPEARK